MSLPAYYKLDLSQTPSVRFVVNHKQDQYRMIFPKVRPTTMELVFLQEGTISELRDSKEYTYATGTVHTFVWDHVVEKYSNAPSIHEFSVGLDFASPCLPMTEEQVAAWVPCAGEAIIPELVEDPKVTVQLEQLIKKTVRSRRSGGTGRYLTFWSHVYEILGLLTEYSVNTVRSRQKSSYARENRYCNRACAYIARRINTCICLQEVADHVGISPGYLSALFSKTMGMSMVEYINRTKVDTVKQLIREMGMTLEQAGASVGISDAKYLSRLFRRYVGMTVHEYKKIHR